MCLFQLSAVLTTRPNSIDDVQDNSVLRRGIPVAHNIFGTAQTINSANYVYFLALQEVRKLNSPAAMEIYTEELLNLHKGQGMDLFWRDTLTCPTEEEYLEMVDNKTGGLFRLAVKLMQAESETGKYVKFEGFEDLKYLTNNKQRLCPTRQRTRSYLPNLRRLPQPVR